MSGLEVVAAVAAVISAFHGGAELLKLAKEKRRTRKVRDLAQLEWEEKQLEKALADGEKQIETRYKQDQEELGDPVRIGDETARDQLNYIASMLRQITNNLRLSATNENCMPSLRMLCEASIKTREETIITLDELKRRIYVIRPTMWQIPRAIELSRPWNESASIQTIPTNNRDPTRYFQTVTTPSNLDFRGTRHVPTQHSGPDSGQTWPAASNPANASSQTADANISGALESLRPEDRAAFIKDLEGLMISYRGLESNGKPNERRDYSQRVEIHPERRDTLSMLQGRDPYDNDRARVDRDRHRALEQTHPALMENDIRSDLGRSAFQQQPIDVQRDQNSFDQQYPRYAAPTAHLPVHTNPTRPRWSDASTSSSASGLWSLNRESSSSSQGSNLQNRPMPSGPAPPSDYPPYLPAPASLNACPQYQNGDTRFSRFASGPYAPEEFYKHPSLCMGSQPRATPTADAIVPQEINSDASLPTLIPWPGSEHNVHSSPNMPYAPAPRYFLPTPERANDTSNPTPPQYVASPPVADSIPNISSNSSESTATGSGFAAIAAAATSALGSATTNARPRPGSLTNSIASSKSSGSAHIGILPSFRKHNGIRTDTIQGGPIGGDKMMSSRPDKSNNYWGFCRGAWDVRDEIKKGMEVCKQPAGYYNNKKVWTCKTCAFTGSVFAPRHTTKSKTDDRVDPYIKTSKSGIRYRWIFLAKSHVKKKAGAPSSVDDTFGCILCNGEGNVTGIYGGVETLMNHIASVHKNGAGMSEQTRKWVKCVWGRTAGDNEDFDINVPHFPEIGELAA